MAGKEGHSGKVLLNEVTVMVSDRRKRKEVGTPWISRKEAQPKISEEYFRESLPLNLLDLETMNVRDCHKNSSLLQTAGG